MTTAEPIVTASLAAGGRKSINPIKKHLPLNLLKSEVITHVKNGFLCDFWDTKTKN